MADDLFTLFDDYAVRWARGEAPDAHEYLARAGPAAGELAELIDRFLASVPPGDPDPDLLASFAAWAGGEPPLLELRVSRGVRRDEIVDAIVKRFRLPQAKRAKVGRYVHQLETGLLDTRGVDPDVLEAWARVLRSRVVDMLAWRPPAPAPQAARSYLRAPSFAQDFSIAASALVEERDEVDELFAGRK